MSFDKSSGQEAISCTGGCHCGRVKFTVDIPKQVKVRKCNCSICHMSGFIHLTVARNDLVLLKGEEDLVEYRFNTGMARHLFCGHCGVKSFYVPRSHPEGYSVNLNCLRIDPEIEIQMGNFDGRHWEDNIRQLREDLGE